MCKTVQFEHLKLYKSIIKRIPAKPFARMICRFLKHCLFDKKTRKEKPVSSTFIYDVEDYYYKKLQFIDIILSARIYYKYYKKRK